MSDEPKPVPSETPGDRLPVGRGVFLVTVAGGVSSLLWGKAAWNRVTGVVSPVAEALVPVLPGSGWRIYSVADHMPRFEPATWRLTVAGLVDRPLTLDYRALRSLPRVEQVSTFHCVTGWTVKNVHWAGVRIGDVIGPARPHARARALRFVSAENPYVDYLTLDQVRLHDVLLAYEMDGMLADGTPLELCRRYGSGAGATLEDVFMQLTGKRLEEDTEEVGEQA